MYFSSALFWFVHFFCFYVFYFSNACLLSSTSLDALNYYSYFYITYL
jgi:hypothetical protein